MFMRAGVVVLASLLCAGHARRVQQADESAFGKRSVTGADRSFTQEHAAVPDPFKALAMFLLATDLSAGFHVGGAGGRSLMGRQVGGVGGQIASNGHHVGPRRPRAAIHMSANMHITGDGVEITEPLQEYAEKKISKALERYEKMINGVPEVHVRVEKRGVHEQDRQGVERQIAEITVSCKDNVIVHASAGSESMYISIDDLSDMVLRKLRKQKEKKLSGKRAQEKKAKRETEAIRESPWETTRQKTLVDGSNEMEGFREAIWGEENKAQRETRAIRGSPWDTARQKVLADGSNEMEGFRESIWGEENKKLGEYK